ncbi:UNVERIFIED_CONTAM: hypothetical protein FKN15_034510 [Acipenser sinensis]
MIVVQTLNKKPCGTGFILGHILNIYHKDNSSSVCQDSPTEASKSHKKICGVCFSCCFKFLLPVCKVCTFLPGGFYKFSVFSLKCLLPA